MNKTQFKTYGPKRLKNGDIIVAEVRHDDCCNNGHNSFGITATIYGKERIPGEDTIKFNGKTYWCHSGGCCHDEVAEAFPELAPLLKWHLCSTDGPLHYVANALYWAGQSGWCDGKPNSPPNESHLKDTIVFGVLPEDKDADPMAMAKEGLLTPWLNSRLPKLLEAFRTDVEKLGFEW